MKVTVYFGNVRVIVPCGNGDILVSDLVELAITRYKKATGKPSSTSVRIHNLKSSRDDGILYPDDQLSDVADDREQIIAEFEETYSGNAHYNCGDGTSTSSVCTGSPDLFSVEVSSHGSIPYAHSDVEITEDSSLSGGMTLQVRRGSEPALNSICPSSPNLDPSKRWSTAVAVNSGSPEKQKPPSEDSESIISRETLVVTNGESSKVSSRSFSRGSGRLSMLGNSAETYRWVEAADRQLLKELNDKLTVKTIEVNGSSERDVASDDCSTGSEEREKTIVLKNESGPLGIHVVPDYDSSGRDMGLVIQGIEAGGRIDRDGRFFVGDRIIKINGKSLCNVSFQAAQEIFKNALKMPQIKLELMRSNTTSLSKRATAPKKPPPPIYPKPGISKPEKSEDSSPLVEGEERAGGVTAKIATVTPTKKMPSTSSHRLATANTRRMGKKVTIKLTKGTSGLGFSITTRDNPAGGSSPIYIKNILPKGAAIEDGRLQPGDRLLEVNGIEMTGKIQSEAVQILRNTPLGGTVDLIVSRQETESAPNAETESQAKPTQQEEEAAIFPWKHREILTFQIPLSDTGSAGLGVSVKGKSTTNATNPVDLGIFIKSIIAGGAASKDGRLQSNDQLVNINGISLLGMSNSNAMETLRKAMTQLDGPIPNTIILTIARRTTMPSEDEQDTVSVHSKALDLNASSERPRKSEGSISELSTSSKHEASYAQISNASPYGQLKGYGSEKFVSGLPGCNPIIEKLTGQNFSNGHLSGHPSDSYLFANVSMNSDRHKTSYSASNNSYETVRIEDEYSPTLANKAKGSEVNGGSRDIKPDPNVALLASSQLSLEEINAGFARDGFGRQSMSEKRHAHLDAKNTDTYQRSKKAREEREQDPDYVQPKQTDSSHDALLSEKEPRGPSLGLRKSSSLESLQTMIQELNKDDEALKNALQSSNSRSARSRGCNESFRAAVDRSYEAPTAMETLDEESESGSSVGHILGRMAEMNDMAHPGISRDPFQDDILNMYCRSSKTSKKKSLLKGLGSVFKFGKSRKNVADLKSKSPDNGLADQDVVLTHHKDQNRPEPDQKLSDVPRKPLPLIPKETVSTSALDSLPNRQERMQSLREQHQRMHQKRQGHYPLDQKEELYENEIKAKEKKMVSSGEVVHSRSHSHDEIGQRGNSRQAFNEVNRYSHYMNYKEIQQHMNQYYHHHNPVPKAVPKTTKSSTSSYGSHKVAPTPPERPSSNYFEYESVQQLHRHVMSQGSEMETNSLPRGSHVTDPNTASHHPSANRHYYNPSSGSGGFDRRNIHHYYPNSALYSHIVPGSKV